VPQAANEEDGNQHNIPPAQETIDQISLVHTEWLSCVMANSYFQMWALSHRDLIFREVTTLIYPTYVTREEGRALLEQLRDTGGAGISGELSERYLPYYIDPNPAHSNQAAPGQIQLGCILLDENGEVIDGESASIAEQKERVGKDIGGGFYYEYWWDHESGRWVIYDNDAGGRG
jgi:hypothetical protein